MFRAVAWYALRQIRRLVGVGMIATRTIRLVTSAIVRLMPSIAMELCRPDSDQELPETLTSSSQLLSSSSRSDSSVAVPSTWPCMM